MPGVSIVIVAAGSGSRTGRGDKMLRDIAGLPLLGHTWRRFDLLSEADEIILVTRDDARPVLEDLAKRINAQKPWQLVAGGVERQDSVWNGVNATAAESEIIVIQDGARPCTPLAAIQLALVTAREMGAAVLARRLADTLKRGDGEGQIVGTVDRENLWTVQTPQVFRREIILAALAKVRDEGLSITDDTAACEALGQSVKLVECDQPNPKATTPADLPYIESLLAE